MNAEDRVLRRAWIGACVAGEALGIGAAALAMRLTDGAPAAIAIGAAVAAGLAEGLALGTAQWLALRRRFPRVRASAWVGATVGTAGLMWALGMIPSTLAAPGSGAEPPLALIALGMAAGGAVAGAGIGAVQGLVLRRHGVSLEQWALSNTLAWALALTWIGVAATLPDAGTPLGLVGLLGVGSGVASGLTVGAITGQTLLRFPTGD